jgi:hypothetical protein
MRVSVTFLRGEGIRPYWASILRKFTGARGVDSIRRFRLGIEADEWSLCTCAPRVEPIFVIGERRGAPGARVRTRHDPPRVGGGGSWRAGARAVGGMGQLLAFQP